MTGANGIDGRGGIKGNGKVVGIGYPNTPILVLRCLGLISTPDARVNFGQYLQAGKNPNRITVIFERTCTLLGLVKEKFTGQEFIHSFTRYQIQGLDAAPGPKSPDYQVRFLLENVFDCALAYHKTFGLAIVSKEEKEGIAGGKAKDYSLSCPFTKQQPAASPIISHLLPEISVSQAGTSLVKYVAQYITGEKKSYSDQLRQRILFHLSEGHYRSAALLLFREKAAKEVLKFIRKEEVATIISAKEMAPLIELSLCEGTQQPVTAEEMVIGFLLKEVHPIMAAYFIEEFTRIDPRGAARIIGIVGQFTRPVELFEYGDMASFADRSLAGYILAAMLIRKDYKLANQLVALGISDPAFEKAYQRILNELHSDFSERVLTADAYQRSGKQSLFLGGSELFQQPEDKSGKAIVKVGNRTYGWGGEELLSPRLFYRNLARQLCETEDFDSAWEIMACGRPAIDAFYDLSNVLDPATFGRLLRTRDRKEIAIFMVKVFKVSEQSLESLAYVLRFLYEDPKDVAGFFEYMIESDVEISGARETAYAILFFGANAIVRQSMEALLDSYQGILAQIELDKGSEGWFGARVFLKEGRFLPTDPPDQIRANRVKFYFDMLKDPSQKESDRIYAARMLGRLRAIEYLDDLRKLIVKDLKSKNYTELSMRPVKAYFDICDELDLSLADHQNIHRRAARFLKAVRDKFVDLFGVDVEIGCMVLATGYEDENNKIARERILERANKGKKQEISELFALARIDSTLAHAGFFKQAVPVVDNIDDSSAKNIAIIAVSLAKAEQPDKAGELFKQFFFDSHGSSTSLIQVASALAQSDLPADKAKILFEQVTALARNILNSGHAFLNFKEIVYALSQIAVVMSKAGLLDEAKNLFEEAIAKVEPIGDSKDKLFAIAQIATALDLSDLSADKKKELFEQAILLVNKTASNTTYYDEEASVLAQIAAALARAGFFEQAIEGTRHITGNEYQLYSLAKITSALVPASLSTDKANELFKQTVVAATRLAHSGYKFRRLAKTAYAMAKIASGLIHAGLPVNKTKELLEQAVFITKEVNVFGDDKNPALAEIASIMAQAGYINRALQVTRMIKSNKEKSKALSTIAVAIHRYSNSQAEGLTPAEKLTAQVLTRVYAVLGMEETKIV